LGLVSLFFSTEAMMRREICLTEFAAGDISIGEGI